MATFPAVFLNHSKTALYGPQERYGCVPSRDAPKDAANAKTH